MPQQKCALPNIKGEVMKTKPAAPIASMFPRFKVLFSRPVETVLCAGSVFARIQSQWIEGRSSYTQCEASQRILEVRRPLTIPKLFSRGSFTQLRTRSIRCFCKFHEV